MSFFFTDTATTAIYTLSLHDALPIFPIWARSWQRPKPLSETRISPSANLIAISPRRVQRVNAGPTPNCIASVARRSEEHTSELQSRRDLVCRLLLEKKNKRNKGRESA